MPKVIFKGIDVCWSLLAITIAVVSLDSNMVWVEGVVPVFTHDTGTVDITELKEGRGEIFPMDTVLTIGAHLI